MNAPRLPPVQRAWAQAIPNPQILQAILKGYVGFDKDRDKLKAQTDQIRDPETRNLIQQRLELTD